MAPNVPNLTQQATRLEKGSNPGGYQAPPGPSFKAPIRKTPCSASPEVTIVQRTTALLRGIDLILELHNAPLNIRRNLDQQIHSYLDTSDDELVWLQRCKYLLAYPLAKYLKNEPPPSPDMSFKPSGRELRNWMKTRLNAFNRSNTHLWYSWFQAKRCTLPLSENVILKNYEKHSKTLSSEDPCPRTGTSDDIFNDKTFLYLLGEVRQDFVRLFRSCDGFVEYQAKTNACYENTRSQGGQQGYLRYLSGLPDCNPVRPLNDNLRKKYLSDDEIREKNNSVPPKFFHALNAIGLMPLYIEGVGYQSDPDGVILNDVMTDMTYRCVVYTKFGVRSNYCVTNYCSDGHEEWSTLMDHGRRMDISKPLNCTIQAVLEPNKVRIISKGEALPYYMCRPFQKSLLAAIQKFPCFKLTGGPMNPEDLRPLTRNAIPTDHWFSVDYSAATDGLSWNYSGRILRFLLEPFEIREQELMLAVLGPHFLHYPDLNKQDISYLNTMMENGQLMGSILSFPILCLANLGVYLLATQENQKYWSHEERLDHVLINGDDMVYASDKSVWEKHVKIGREVGLEMSIGKAYVHREYLNINSTSFHCPLHSAKDSSHIEICEIPYLNAGLFFGLHKVQGGHNIETAQNHDGLKDGIVANIQCLLQGSRPGKQSELLKKLLVTQKETIGKECRTKTRQGKTFCRNLFIPQQLGGMGVCAPDGFNFRITKEEVYVASGFIKELPDCECTSQRPLPGYPLNSKLESVQIKPWTSKDLDTQPSPTVPVNKYSDAKIRHLCRVGFFRYFPNAHCYEAKVEPSFSKGKPQTVLYRCSPILESPVQSDMESYFAGPNFVEKVPFVPIRPELFLWDFGGEEWSIIVDLSWE